MVVVALQRKEKEREGQSRPPIADMEWRSPWGPGLPGYGQAGAGSSAPKVAGGVCAGAEWKVPTGGHQPGGLVHCLWGRARSKHSSSGLVSYSVPRRSAPTVLVRSPFRPLLPPAVPTLVSKPSISRVGGAVSAVNCMSPAKEPSSTGRGQCTLSADPPSALP